MHKYAAHRHIVVDHENTILRQAKKFSDTKAVGFGHNILSESPQKLRHAKVTPHREHKKIRGNIDPYQPKHNVHTNNIKLISKKQSVNTR